MQGQDQYAGSTRHKYAFDKAAYFSVSIIAFVISAFVFSVSAQGASRMASAEDISTLISVDQAVESIENTTSGYVQQIQLVRNSERAYYDVFVNRNHALEHMTLDAKTGRIVLAEAGQLDVLPVTSTAPVVEERHEELAEPSRSRVSVYGGMATGQIAGMQNVILKPKYVAGLKVGLVAPNHPELETSVDTRLIYGKTQFDSQSTSTNRVQEWRGNMDAVYNLHNNKDVSKIGIGLYAEFALPLHYYESYSPTTPDEAYAAGENHVLKKQFAYGLDFKVSLKDRRFSSELQNVLFFGGSRIGPNLLTYQPLIGMLWHNEVSLWGSGADSKLKFFADANVYFARKNNVALFNLHDGLGGTKREIYLSYGFMYSFSKYTSVRLLTYGYNNLNRGNSNEIPTGFRDGFALTLEHQLF